MTAAATMRSGFVHQLPDPLTIVPANAQHVNTCMPDALSWLAGRVDDHVQKLIDQITTAWKPYVSDPQQARNVVLAQRLTYTPLIHFAKGTGQSALELFKNHFKNLVIHQMKTSLGVDHSAIEQTLQSGPLEDGSLDGMIEVLKARIPENATPLRDHLRQTYPTWTAQKCHQKATDISIAYSVYSLLVANHLGLTKADWNPTKSYSEFVACLTKGPLMVMGRFGRDYYTTAPESYKDRTILDKPVLKWPKGAPRSNIAIVHAVLIIGVPLQEDSNELVYFADIYHPNEIYVISYANLKQSVSLAVSYNVKSFPDYVSQATYAFQNPNWQSASVPL